MFLLRIRWPYNLLSKLEPFRKIKMRNCIYKWTMARPSIKTELWLTICSNQPRKPVCYLPVRPIGSQTIISSKQSRKPNNKPCNKRLQMTRTPLITDSFPNFSPCSFNSQPTRESQYASLISHIGYLVSSWVPATSPMPSVFNSGQIWSLPFFSY